MVQERNDGSRRVSHAAWVVTQLCVGFLASVIVAMVTFQLSYREAQRPTFALLCAGGAFATTMSLAISIMKAFQRG